MSRKKVIFLGSKFIGYLCLKHLLEHVDVYRIEILGVVTKSHLLDEEVSVASLIGEFSLNAYPSVTEIPNCDIIISIQHHEILKQQDIHKAKEVAVNLHMAPLPEYRGCNQFSFAIMDGRKEFGTTLHKMTPGIDDGDIIAERRFEIADNIWVDDLYQQTVLESELLFKGAIGSIIDKSYATKAQADLIKERGMSYHYRNEIHDLKLIDENWPDEKKKLHIRATYKKGFEPPYTVINGEKKYYNKESFLF